LALTRSLEPDVAPPPVRTPTPPPVAPRRRRLHLTPVRGGVLLALLALAGFGIWKATHRGPKPVEVQTGMVERADLQSKVTANGKVQAQRKVDISATIAGQITVLAVKEGDRVSKGQFLLQIDPVSPRATARSSEASMQALLREVDSARAALAQGRLDLERAEANFKGRIIPEMEVQRARTAVATAQAAFSGAERRVEHARCSKARGTRCRRRWSDRRSTGS
jgi:multidrug efflux pump subunit AcrA (membrane-fusion protein)